MMIGPDGIHGDRLAQVRLVKRTLAVELERPEGPRRRRRVAEGDRASGIPRRSIMASQSVQRILSDSMTMTPAGAVAAALTSVRATAVASAGAYFRSAPMRKGRIS